MLEYFMFRTLSIFQKHRVYLIAFYYDLESTIHITHPQYVVLCTEMKTLIQFEHVYLINVSEFSRDSMLKSLDSGL